MTSNLSECLHLTGLSCFEYLKLTLTGSSNAVRLDEFKGYMVIFIYVQQVGPQGCTSAWSDIRRFTTLDNTAVKNNFDDIFKIYPNPAKSVLTIEFSQIPDMSSTIEIMDITGKTVYSVKIQNFNNLNGNKLNINLAELSDGFYSCKITNEKTNVVKMLVVKK